VIPSWTRNFVVLIAIAGSLRSSPAREHLIRRDVEHDEYRDAIRRLLSQGWGNDIVVRLVDIPPFQKEAIMGIRRVKGGYEAFSIEPSRSIWSEAEKRFESKRPDFSKIRADYRHRPISESLTRRYVAFWQYILADSNNYKADKNALYTDTSKLYFLVRPQGSRPLAAYFLEMGPKSKQLMYVAYDLFMFCRLQKVNEDELLKYVKKSERAVGITAK